MSRAKEYDVHDVLKNALNIFWEKGYKGTSLTDLTNATGLHKGSLYSEFSSKEEIFIKSLELYGKRARERFLRDECPLDYIENFLRRLVRDGGQKKISKGCLILNSNIEFGREKSAPARLSRKLFDEIELNFKRALDLAELRGIFPGEIDKSAFLARIMGGVFSIREISRFRNDECFLGDIANGILKEIGRRV